MAKEVSKSSKNNTVLVLVIAAVVLILIGACGALIFFGSFGSLAMLGFVASKNLETAQDKANETVFKNEMLQIQVSLEEYYVENMEYPTDLVEVGYSLPSLNWVANAKGETIGSLEYRRIGKDDYVLEGNTSTGEYYRLTPDTQGF